MSPKRPSARGILGLFAAFLATSVVAGVLAAGLALPAIGASGFAAKHSVDFFDSLPGELEQPELSEQTVVLAADGSKIAQFYDENRINVPLSAIAPVMQQAIIAIEDSRFREHGGVDPKGLARAAVTNVLRGESAQGASTLTQQYVKNVLIETAVAAGNTQAAEDAREKSPSRKLKEIKYAITLEKSMTKDQILNAYLNITFFGGQVYGVEAASLYYFSKHAKDLTLPQAALLAGMVQAPTAYNPVRHPADSVVRRNVVLHRMLDLHMISQLTYQRTVATKLALTVKQTRNGCANAGYNGYFCDYVTNLIKNDPGFASLGKTVAQRTQALSRGGLTIRTTLSPTIQRAAYQALTGTIPATDKSHVAAAAVTIEPGTGKVLALNQNKLFGPNAIPGETSLNYSVDHEYGGSQGFQTGSTFKAFTLADWLTKHKTLNQIVPANNGPAPFSDFTSCGKQLKGDEYSYFNSETTETAPISVLNATAESVNTAFVAMEKQLDLCDIRNTAMSMGVHLAEPTKPDCPYSPADAKLVIPGTKTKTNPSGLTQALPSCIPSLTLGPKNISPMTMAAAYATFADRGVFCKPISVTSIVDRNHKSLAVPQPSCSQVLDPDVVAAEDYALTQVLTRGTAAKVGMPGRPAAGKTGTSNDSVDTWFAGFTPQRSTAVWVGDPNLNPNGHTRSGKVIYERTTLNKRTIDGKKQKSVFGATFAAPIWKKIMLKAHDGLPKLTFDNPPQKLLGSSQTKVPNVQGQSVAAAVATLTAAGFKPSVSNAAVPSTYPAGTVAFTSPGAGTNVAKGSTVAIAISAGPIITTNGTTPPTGGTKRGGGRGGGGPPGQVT